MKLLAIDTSTDACSVALLAGDSIEAEHVVEPRAHTRILVPMIRRRLESGGVDLASLDALVLGNGPGSFIGMRIGAAVAQGLAFGAGLRIVPVSSLAAIAAEVFATTDAVRVVVTQDARMGEVYRAVFERGEDGLPVESGETKLENAALAGVPVDAVVAGGGWQRYPEMRAALPPGTRFLPVLQPDARHLLACGRRDFEKGLAVDPVLLEPAYVRQKVAEVPGRQARTPGGSAPPAEN